MKTVLVTGASGYLGSNLIASLFEIENCRVIAVLGRPEDKSNFLPQSDRIVVYPCSELFTTDFGHVDTLIHTAFSRGDNLQGLTASIELTEKVIELVNNGDIDSIVNISSQGIYQGLKPGEMVTEKGAIGPNTAYGLAKWAVENMLKVGCKKQFTSIRMASLGTNARFLDCFVKSVIAHKDIIVTAPKQYASIMDVSDAVRGILSIVELPLCQREMVYNLGPGVQYSILDYAQLANSIGESFGYQPVNIIIEGVGNEFAICMDCKKLMGQVDWQPKVTKEMILQNMFNSIIADNDRER